MLKNRVLRWVDILDFGVHRECILISNPRSTTHENPRTCALDAGNISFGRGEAEWREGWKVTSWSCPKTRLPLNDELSIFVTTHSQFGTCRLRIFTSTPLERVS